MKDTTNISIHHTDKIEIGRWGKLMDHITNVTYSKDIIITTLNGSETKITLFKNVPKGEKPNE